MTAVTTVTTVTTASAVTTGRVAVTTVTTRSHDATTVTSVIAVTAVTASVAAVAQSTPAHPQRSRRSADRDPQGPSIPHCSTASWPRCQARWATYTQRRARSPEAAGVCCYLNKNRRLNRSRARHHPLLPTLQISCHLIEKLALLHDIP